MGHLDVISFCKYNVIMANVLLRMADDLYQELKEIAKQEERSINKQLIFIIKKYIEDYKKNQQR